MIFQNIFYCFLFKVHVFCVMMEKHEVEDMGLIEQKKADKRRRLLESAYSLFAEKGAASTSIAEICEKSGIAKGTFYLYFEDKQDLEQTLNSRISHTLYSDGLEYAIAHHTESVSENVVGLMDYLIDRFEADNDLLKVLRRGFSWDFSLHPKEGTGENPDFLKAKKFLDEDPALNGVDQDEFLKKLCVTFSMVTDTAYFAILYQIPGTMNEMKPILEEMIRKAF